MYVGALVTVALFSITILAHPLRGQAELSNQLEAETISAAYSTRVAEFGDSARVEGCALSRLLGDPTAYLPLLSEPLRSRVTPGDSTACARSEGVHPPGAWWYVDGVEQVEEGAVEVHARLLVPHSREREETYRLQPGPNGRFRVSEIRLRPSIEKVTQPLVPPRTPPEARPAPHLGRLAPGR